MFIWLSLIVALLLLFVAPSRPALPNAVTTSAAPTDEDDDAAQPTTHASASMSSISSSSSSPLHVDAAHNNNVAELPPTRLARLLRFVNQHLAFESGKEEAKRKKKKSLTVFLCADSKTLTLQSAHNIAESFAILNQVTESIFLCCNRLHDIHSLF